MNGWKILTWIAGALIGSASAAPPNIVMIISDDHGWADYSFMGHTHLRTPHLDKLASQSLLYTRGYVPSSLCRPSLAVMITGLYPHQTKIVSNDPPRVAPAPDAAPPAEPRTKGKAKAKATAKDSPAFLALRAQTQKFIQDAPTVPRLLQSLGYVSFQTGKWWEGSYHGAGFTDGMTQGQRHGDAGLDIGRKTMQPMYDFMDKAVAAGKPFYLWYAPMMPHSPHNPPQEYLDKYKAKAPTEAIAKYWAMVDWFDVTCGQLLGHLDQRGLAQNTIVVYVVDNGWFQDPAADKYAPKSKQSPYDGGLRTPIMIRWPGKVAPRRDETPVSSIDLAPTLLLAAGLKPDPRMTGVNLLDESAVKARPAVYGEIFEHNAVDIHKPATSLKHQWAIRWPHKLILPRGPQQIAEGGPELYDIQADPYEEKNLAAGNEAMIAQLKAVIEQHWKPDPAGP